MSNNLNYLQQKRMRKYDLLAINNSTMAHNRYKNPNHRIKSQQLNSNLSFLTKAQSQLEKQISAINVSLHRKYRSHSYKNGLIFKHEVDYHLANYIRQMLDSQNEINSWGFTFDKQIDDQKQYKKERLLQKVLKANRLGTQSLKLPPKEQNFIKHNYTPQLIIDKWDYFSKGATLKYYKQQRKLKTQPKVKQIDYPSLASSFNQNLLTKSTPNKREKINHSQLKSRKTPIFTTQSPKIIRKSLTPPQIYQLIHKQQKFISIWFPPSNNPELLGIITFLIRQKQDGSQLCMIRKYWWINKYVNKTTFNCILDWLCSQFGYIDELTLLTNQTNFDSTYASIGWKLTNWIREQKLRITYKRGLI